MVKIRRKHRAIYSEPVLGAFQDAELFTFLETWLMEAGQRLRGFNRLPIEEKEGRLVFLARDLDSCVTACNELRRRVALKVDQSGK